MTTDQVERVRRARAGDREAFDLLAAAIVDRLYAIARLILRDMDRAEDAVQETLVRCWRDLPALRDPVKFDAWVRRLLMRAITDEFRSDRRQRAAITILRIEPAGADASAEIAVREQLDRGFQRLTIDHRSVIVLRLYLGLSVGGPSQSSTPLAGPTSAAPASAVTRESFAAARAIVCQRYTVQANPLKAELGRIFVADLPADQRAVKINALDQIRAITVAEIKDLQVLDVPADLAADHTASIARMQDNLSLIVQVLGFLKAGKLAEAQAVDLATDPISPSVEAFENRYGLSPCP